VLGRRPITVTSGATPLEGLPGETNSGEIDPAVALALAGEAGLGPEGANALLVGGSGLFRSGGPPCALGDVLTSTRSECTRAREVLLYRMLLASGTAAAALGGVDAVVFSGRYVSCSAVVAQYVLPHLDRAGALGPHAAEWTIFASHWKRFWRIRRLRTERGAAGRPAGVAAYVGRVSDAEKPCSNRLCS